MDSEGPENLHLSLLDRPEMKALLERGEMGSGVEGFELIDEIREVLDNENRPRKARWRKERCV